MIRFAHRSALLLALLALGAGQVQAGYIFNTFSPGDVHSSEGGYLVSGKSSSFNVDAHEGFSFTAGSTEALKRVEVSFFRAGGSTAFNLGLYADDGLGHKGALIESFNGLQLGSSHIVSVDSALNPVLAAGTQYWLVATPGDANTAIAWYANDIGVTSTLYQSFDGGVGYLAGQKTTVFRLTGEPLLPEPSATPGPGGLALLVSGLPVGLLAWRRRRAA